MAKETPTVTKLPQGAEGVPRMTQPLVILTVKELAAYLKVEPSSVYERTRFRSSRDQHPIPAHKMGGYWRFLRHEIDAWLMSLPQATKTTKRKYNKESRKQKS